MAEFERLCKKMVRETLGIPITEADWQEHVQTWGANHRPHNGELRIWAEKYGVPRRSDRTISNDPSRRSDLLDES